MHISHSDISFNLTLECYQKTSTPTDQLDHYLTKGKFESIIHNSNVFWLAYCKALQPNVKKENQDFSVSVKGNLLHVSGKKGTIQKTQNMIEKLRQFFLIDNQIFEIFVIKTSEHYFLKKNNVLNNKVNLSKGYPQDWYHNYIKPALLQLTEFCGALYAEKQKMNAIEIRIHRKKIPIRICQSAQNQEHPSYDLNLICKDASAIQVKSDLLYTYGGPVFQQLLTSGMKENIDHTISLIEYPQTTVEAFVTFIRSKGKKVSHRLKLIELIELFKLAHFYQLDSLIDNCTNLIASNATWKSLKTIRRLLKYDNTHLKQLYDHLVLKKATLKKSSQKL